MQHCYADSMVDRKLDIIVYSHWYVHDAASLHFQNSGFMVHFKRVTNDVRSLLLSFTVIFPVLNLQFNLNSIFTADISTLDAESALEIPKRKTTLKMSSVNSISLTMILAT